MMTALQTPSAALSAVAPAVHAGAQINADAFEIIRRRMMLEFCKWDAQVGDVSTLADFPLVIPAAQWCELEHAAEVMTRETLEMETRLLDRPDLHRSLGLPRRLRGVMRDAGRDGVFSLRRPRDAVRFPSNSRWMACL